MSVPEEYEEDINHHEKLFSGPSLRLGKIHWYIQKADTEMDSRCHIEKRGKRMDVMIDTTAFGEEVGLDEIKWWIFKKETEVEELRKRTKITLNSVQKLKEDALLLKERFSSKLYPSLIGELKDFTEGHKKEIRDLYDYIFWLHNKDVLAPCILFTYRVWGSTRLSDRTIRITAKAIDEDHPAVKKSVEVVLGLKIREVYTLGIIYSDIIGDIADSIDVEYQGPIVVNKQIVVNRTLPKVLDEFATYFEFMRQSLRNILLEIDEYDDQMRLLHRESFWCAFIQKAMSNDRVENQLWDFKASLEMWHPGHREREKAQFEFCEQVASFANTTGGVLIIGVTDKLPRKILGLQGLENKMKSTKEIIRKHSKYGNDFTHFQQVPIKDESGKGQNCLVIAIAQTKEGVSVKDQQGKYSFPMRLETGLDRTDHETIKDSKQYITRDNYYFISDLNTFLHDR